VPLPWLVGPLAILGCLYLFWSLPDQTKLFFLLWNLAGLGLYLWIVRRRRLSQAAADAV